VTPLTDAQVAALVVMAEGDLPLRSMVESGDLERLCLEVQQSRQRRCGDCAHAYPPEPGSDFWWCRPLDQGVGPDWFCADFTPKETR
jgi:hypothetical protein